MPDLEIETQTDTSGITTSPVCRWCGKHYEEHVESHKNGAVPRVPCQLLKSGFVSRVKVTRTDVQNVIDSVNMILKSYGIRFEFDDKQNLQCIADGIPDLRYISHRQGVQFGVQQERNRIHKEMIDRFAGKPATVKDIAIYLQDVCFGKSDKEPERKNQFTSKDVSIELHKYGFYVPSLYCYEWTGATQIEKLNESGWLEDSINIYTEAEIDAHFPKNVAVNENVKEFGIKPDDNAATKKARVLVYLLKTGIIERIDAT